MIRWPGLIITILLSVAMAASSFADDAREISGEDLGAAQQSDAARPVKQEQETAPDQPADPGTEPEPETRAEPEKKAESETATAGGDTSGVNDPFMKKWDRFKTAWRDITTYNLWDGMFRMRMGFRAQADATLERTDTTVEELVGQAGGYVGRNIDRFRHRQGPALYFVPQVLAVVVVHADEHLPFRGLVDLMDGADVVVLEGGSGLRFTDKARLGILVAGDIPGKKLQRYGALEPGVFGLVDNAHPSLPEFVEDPVVRDGLTDQSGYPPESATRVPGYLDEDISNSMRQM